MDDVENGGDMRLQQAEHKHVLVAEVRFFPASVQIDLAQEFVFIENPDADNEKTALVANEAVAGLVVHLYDPVGIVLRPVDIGLFAKALGAGQIAVVLALVEFSFADGLFRVPLGIGLEIAAIPADGAKKHTAVKGDEVIQPEYCQFQKIRKGVAVVCSVDKVVQQQ